MRKLQTVLGGFTFKTKPSSNGVSFQMKTPDLVINLGNIELKNMNILTNGKIRVTDLRNHALNPLIERDVQFKTFKIVHPINPNFPTIVELDGIGSINGNFSYFFGQETVDISKIKWKKITYVCYDGETYSILFTFNLLD